MVLDKKICGTCKEEKELKQFSKDRSKKDGLSAVCKDCSNKRGKQFRNNPKNYERLNHSFKKYEKSDKGRLSRKKVIKKRSQKPKSVQQKIIHNCRVRVSQGIKNNVKSQRTINLIGCTIQQLKQHLESQFKPGMSWDNYGKGIGKWSIDHIKPICLFDLTKEEEQKKCFHYSNLQPLWTIDNSLKGGNYDS